MKLPRAIISGGQTGADRAGLDFAVANKIPHGGWCPAGRRCEDGVIPLKYKLLETPNSDYGQRTAWNVRDSEATLIFNRGRSLSPGCGLTMRHCEKGGKPYLIVQYSGGETEAEIETKARQVVEFLEYAKPGMLNIAGNREHTSPGIALFVSKVLTAAWSLAKMHTAAPDELPGYMRGEQAVLDLGAGARAGRGVARSGGFTIIEMLTVLAVIGILVGVGTLVFNTVRRDAGLAVIVKQINDVTGLYAEWSGKWGPMPTDGVVINVQAGTALAGSLAVNYPNRVFSGTNFPLSDFAAMHYYTDFRQVLVGDGLMQATDCQWYIPNVFSAISSNIPAPSRFGMLAPLIKATTGGKYWSITPDITIPAFGAGTTPEPRFVFQLKGAPPSNYIQIELTTGDASTSRTLAIELAKRFHKQAMQAYVVGGTVTNEQFTITDNLTTGDFSLTEKYGVSANLNSVTGSAGVVTIIKYL